MKKELPLLEKKSTRSRPMPDPGGETIPLRIAYIGGGSRGWAHMLIKDLLLYPGFTGEVRLYDINRPMAELNAKYGNWMQGHPRAVSKWKYRVVASLKAALKDADFVFASIMPGPIEYMKFDLEEPMKHGIYQPVGDTVGPGGAVRALRAVRDYAVMARAIGEFAPKAWVLNFTNPMTVCTRTLHAVFPGIKAYGCCHEVFGTQNHLAQVYHEMTGEPKPPRDRIDVNVLGINHFTWIDQATYEKTDLLDLLRAYIRMPGRVRRHTKREVEAKRSLFATAQQVKYELFRRFGVLAAAGDRHLAEFVPWFLTDKESCFRWGFTLTPYVYRINRYRQAPKQFRETLRKGEYPELSDSGEEYIRQMRALTGSGTLKTNVNLPNLGQIRGLPLNAVVETNALFSAGRVQPLTAGALPDNVNILTLRHVLNQESLVKAALTGDRDLAFQAFLNDPLVHLPVDKAEKLFDTMLRKTRYVFTPCG